MNKELTTKFFLKELSDIDIEDFFEANEVIIGLDIGDKTVGVAVSDRRKKIASFVTVILRKQNGSDCAKLFESIRTKKPKLILFGWPLQMNGQQSAQCEKNLKFVEEFYDFLQINYADFLSNLYFSKWDERFSTKAVTNIMIEADLSRKRRKEVIDKTAAVYILQGALDFLNRK